MENQHSLSRRLQVAVGAFVRELQQREGQDLVEYALLVSLVALGTTAALSKVAAGVNTAYANVAASLVSYTSQSASGARAVSPGNGNSGSGSGGSHDGAGGSDNNGSGSGSGDHGKEGGRTHFGSHSRKPSVWSGK